jgi:epoxyqueuosine reductase
MQSPSTHALQVKDFAASLDFDLCGIARADAVDPGDRLGEWLRAGRHADMDWMARTKELRQDVQLKLPGARSVVVVARNYYQPDPPHAPNAPRVARYARGRDYHKVLKRPLRKLAEFIITLEAGARCDAGVDSAPFLERGWAAKAGIGWVGRNSLVLNRELGSGCFLGVVATTVELTPDAPATPHCGSCRACMDACPTGAIVEDGVVDSTRCISYQTIENRGQIPRELAEKMAPWVFGCDICQEVCPWNRFATPTTEPDFAVREAVAFPNVEQVLDADEETFVEIFGGTPVMRAKRVGMQRNLLQLLRRSPASPED